MLQELKRVLKSLFDRGLSVWTVEHAPTRSGGHTSFQLIRRSGQSEVIPWPLENFLLCTKEDQMDTRIHLARSGYTLSLF